MNLYSTYFGFRDNGKENVPPCTLVHAIAHRSLNFI